MRPTITAFAQSPDKGQGVARDMPVRWALEEVGQPYDVELVSMKALKEATHRALHPFGKIPTYQEGALTLFESGAIVFYIARHHEGLLPQGDQAQARTLMWMFAAVNTVEPPIVEREGAMITEGDTPWMEARQPLLDSRVRERLGELSNYLEDHEWLEADFSAGDILMVQVFRRLEDTHFLEDYRNLALYVERGKDRPAFQRAFAAQLAVAQNQ